MNHSKLKVLTVVGTRPEIIRLARVISLLDQCCDHVLVHTGQNFDYELNEVFFNELGLREPDYLLNSAIDSHGAAQTIGNIITAVDKVLERENPSAMLVLGDTNSCLSVIAAKRRKIPIFHMEAGNRCFDQRVPEEINRRIVDHTSDINLTYSAVARGYLIAEGLSPERSIYVGSPMSEVINYYLPKIKKSDAIERLKLKKNDYFLVSVHREENIEPHDSFDKLVTSLNKLAAEFNCPVIVSTHPRTRKRIKDLGSHFHENVKVLKPMGFFDYVSLEMGAKVVLSDSGTITEESSILGFPALNLRETHERLEGMEEAVVMMVGLDWERIRQAIDILIGESRTGQAGIRAVPDYSVPNVSEKIVRIIHSYTDYVRRVVWRDY